MSALFLHRSNVRVDGRLRDILLVFVASSMLDDADFRDKINYHIDRDLTPDEILIAVRHPIADQVRKQFAESRTLDALKSRIGNKATISIRAFDAAGKEIECSPVHGSDITPVAIHTLARRVMTQLARERHVFVEAAGNYHFELPSQRHTERFLRITNFLVDFAEISFIAFALLPFVTPDVKVAYIDTPSLFPVISALSEHLHAFDKNREAVRAENFRSYSGYSTYPFAVDPRSFVLISASSSGRLAHNILTIARFEAKQLIHLLYSGREEHSNIIVCNIIKDDANPDGFANFPQDYSAGDCALCADHSPVVQLVGDNFELPGPKPMPLIFGVADKSPRFSDLIRRVVGREALRVGFGRANQANVARQFFVDSDKLIDALVATNRLPYVLNQAVPATLTSIVALNEQSMRLANLIRNHATTSGTKEPKVFLARDLDQVEPDPEAKCILVAASVIESGRSLQDASRDLRRPYPNAPQIYIVGLAKYRSIGSFRRLQSNLTQTHGAIPHEFVAMEQIPLPTSSDVNNAWLAEQALLSKPEFFSGMDDREESDWSNRSARLRRLPDPLIQDLFVSSRIETPLKLQSGFALWPDGLAEKGSQADVFFTIASVLQNLRAREEEEGVARALRSDIFQQTIIDPSNFGRFSDGIIQAAFLRGAHPHELNYSNSPNDSRDMARYCRRVIESADKPRGEAAAEMLLAIATRRLRLAAPDYREILSPVDGLPPRVERLRLVATSVLKLEGLL